MSGHSHFTPANVEEHFEFTAAAKKKIFISLIVGVAMFVLGCIFLANGVGETHHEAATAPQHEVAKSSVAEHAIAVKGEEAKVETGHSEVKAEAEHHGSVSGGHHEYHWTKRLWANLWLNSVFFAGLAVVGMFFVSLQYLAKAGWSSVLKRVPEAFPAFLPVVGVLMLIIFIFGGHDLFHWTNDALYDKSSPEYDKIIAGKHGFLNKPFYIISLVLYFVVWYGLWRWLRAKSIQ